MSFFADSNPQRLCASFRSGREICCQKIDGDQSKGCYAWLQEFRIGSEFSAVYVGSEVVESSQV